MLSAWNRMFINEVDINKHLRLFISCLLKSLWIRMFRTLFHSRDSFIDNIKTFR